ncbi:sugar ABC transporter ATP-binding protein [Robinsoniella peoriensis]|uniref:sugar ABC transporter ATP-binding protein n=1 Tax=Robinsoniella peoriensis TaxID=180332 RepID=UPI0005C7BFFD|nr:sugar ABC transporter ATP-binding protein [Robinsoniella peoriensis]
MAETLLKLTDITKEFPGVLALNNVRLDIKEAEVLALVGENGAGKSTLIKILTGALNGWTGEILWKGEPLKVHYPWEAQQAGISTIYQELTLCPDITVSENIFLGREPKKNGLIDWAKMNAMTAKVLERLEVSVSPTEKVSRLNVATQQLIEIGRALTMNAQLIIMDEPTSSLSEHEVYTLMKIIKDLKANGISILYISHKFNEIFDISDRISVLRDGEYVDTVNTSEANIDKVLEMMVGRTVNIRFKDRTNKIGDEIFAVEGLSSKGVFEDISFYLNEGEILGVSGLVGAGRTEMARAIFGIDKSDSGTITIGKKKRNLPRSPKEALKLGIGFLPEDRKDEGLVLLMSVLENSTLAKLAKNVSNTLINAKKERILVDEYVRKLTIKTPSSKQLTRNLSGGNQQKVVIAKWLLSKSKILIFDEPTRGIDVGAKAEIYDLMNELVADGYGIIMISSELPEVIGMSDRIMVMQEGKVAGIFNKGDVTPEEIISYATGAGKN